MTASAARHYDLLVIGGGPGGLAAARFARRRNPELKIGLIRSQERSVVPCAMPYALDRTISADDFLKSDEVLLHQANIDLYLGVVESIDPENRSLKVTGSEAEAFTYDELIVATGAQPIRPPIPGADLPGTHVVKDAPDIHAIAEDMKSASRGVVVGGGYIGLEVAIAFKNAGLESHVVEMLPVCLGNVCTELVARRALDELVEHGIIVHNGQAAREVLGTDHVEAVRVEDTVIETPLVVFAIGVRADTRLLSEAGAEIGRFGVVVDDRMHTSLPHIWSVGDCIEHRNFITGEPANGPLATNAVVQGKVAAVNVTGGRREFIGFINPSVTRLFEFSYGSTGLNADKAAQAGIEVILGQADAFTRDKPFPGSGPISLVLVFDAKTTRIIGAECVAAEGVAERLDALTLGIIHHLTMADLAEMHFSGHPPQTDVPARMAIVNAAEDAMRKAELL